MMHLFTKSNETGLDKITTLITMLSGKHQASILLLLSFAISNVLGFWECNLQVPWGKQSLHFFPQAQLCLLDVVIMAWQVYHSAR